MVLKLSYVQPEPFLVLGGKARDLQGLVLGGVLVVREKRLVVRLLVVRLLAVGLHPLGPAFKLLQDVVNFGTLFLLLLRRTTLLALRVAPPVRIYTACGVGVRWQVVLVFLEADH